MSNNKKTTHGAEPIDDRLKAVLKDGVSHQHTGQFDHHPSVEELYDYVTMTLPSQESEYVMRHIAFCKDCADEVWRIRGLEEEFAESFTNHENKKDETSTESQPKVLKFPVKKKLSLKSEGIKYLLPLAACVALVIIGARLGLFDEMFGPKSAEKQPSEPVKIATAPKLSDDHQLMGVVEDKPAQKLSLDDQLINAAGSGDNALLEKLLAEGAKINAVDKTGMTPLAKAAAKGNRTTVLILLRKGADKQIRDKMGKTPQDHATENGHESISNLLQ